MLCDTLCVSPDDIKPPESHVKLITYKSLTRPTCEDLHFITLPSHVFDVYVVTCENRIWNRILKKNFWKMNSKATRDNSSEPNKGRLLLNKLVKIKARTFLSFRLISCFWWCNWFFVKLDISWENREIIFQIGKWNADPYRIQNIFRSNFQRWIEIAALPKLPLLIAL